MVKVGITGGIGSGKSTVCNVWERLGAYVINADALAKKIMTTDELVKKEIINVFGPESYHPDGRLNRKFLAKEAFEKDRVNELNAIVHPRVPLKVASLMENAADQGYNVVVYEAALLLQNLRPDHLDHIVLVLAPEEKRTEWVKKRDEVSKEHVLERIEKQQNFDELTHLADTIIHNDGTLEELKQKAEVLYRKFVNANPE